MLTTTNTATIAIEGLIRLLEEFRYAVDQVDRVGDILVRALANGKKVLSCGNGGSAADALHLTEELVGRYKGKRRALPAICLVSDSTLLTCISNDFGFEHAFSRQMEALANPGDVAVFFSTSGNSRNLIAALEAARSKGATTVALLGKTGGQMRDQSDHQIFVPSNETARVQEIHTLVFHSWLEKIDAYFVEA
jgi:D-sedoheptulose 7-phosphate isomerase